MGESVGKCYCHGHGRDSSLFLVFLVILPLVSPVLTLSVCLCVCVCDVGMALLSLSPDFMIANLLAHLQSIYALAQQYIYPSSSILCQTVVSDSLGAYVQS